MKNDLLENIEKLHTTPMGVDRIRCNLSLGDDVKVKILPLSYHIPAALPPVVSLVKKEIRCHA